VYSGAVASYLGCSWANIVFFLETLLSASPFVCREKNLDECIRKTLTITSGGMWSISVLRQLIFVPTRVMRPSDSELV
jgi:hypothetical protein